MVVSLHRWRLGQRLCHARGAVDDTRWPGWQVVIGIETHAKIKARHKLFSDAPLATTQHVLPNSLYTPFDAAFPGTLPKLNHICVDLAIRTALSVNATIQTKSSFDRKHYFYADLPSGYQITQQYAPIALGGQILIPALNPRSRPIPIRIKRIQLEQDTAKSTSNPLTKTSYIDLNRAGAGLMEIVSEPDIRSPEEAGAYVRTLRSILRAVGASDGNMEQGSMRCDVNVSINRVGQPWGTRCEIKNLNSVRFMMGAIIHEIHRHRTILSSSSSGTVEQETRGFDEHTYNTFRLRSKEDAPNYRYMPDPNLGVLHIHEDRVEEVRRNIPELPYQTRSRLREKYGLSDRDVEVLQAVDGGRGVPFDGETKSIDHDLGAIAYFDLLCQTNRDPKAVSNWMTHELLGQLATRNETFSSQRIPHMHLGELIDMVQDGTITGSSGKILLRHMLNSPSSVEPSKLAVELKLAAISPLSSSALFNPSSELHSELRSLCIDAIRVLPKEAAAVRAGHTKVLNKIVGKVMNKCRGRADARETKAVIQELLSGPPS